MKTKKQISENDVIKAVRRGSRQAEIEAHGHPVPHGHIQKSKKLYDRKKAKATLEELP
jgi:hypothetical protein